MTRQSLAPGLWVVLATPYDGAGLVEDESLVRQVRLAEAVGATGVVALGAFGEAAALSSQERARIIRTVTAATDLPIVVGLPGRATAVVVEEAEHMLGSATRDLEAVMIQAHSAVASLVTEHLTAVHDATGAAVVLQDYPVISGVTIACEDLIEVVRACAFVVAVKAEAAPAASSVAELSSGTDVSVFGGLGGVGLLDELAAGAAGAMTGFSYPEGLRTTLDAWRDGGFETARDAWAPWLPLANFEGQTGIGLALRKEILRRRGILASAQVRPPTPRVPHRLLPLLDQHLSTLPSVGGCSN